MGQCSQYTPGLWVPHRSGWDESVFLISGIQLSTMRAGCCLNKGKIVRLETLEQNVWSSRMWMWVRCANNSKYVPIQLWLLRVGKYWPTVQLLTTALIANYKDRKNFCALPLCRSDKTVTICNWDTFFYISWSSLVDSNLKPFSVSTLRSILNEDSSWQRAPRDTTRVPKKYSWQQFKLCQDAESRSTGTDK